MCAVPIGFSGPLWPAVIFDILQCPEHGPSQPVCLLPASLDPPRLNGGDRRHSFWDMHGLLASAKWLGWKWITIPRYKPWTTPPSFTDISFYPIAGLVSLSMHAVPCPSVFFLPLVQNPVSQLVSGFSFLNCLFYPRFKLPTREFWKDDYFVLRIALAAEKLSHRVGSFQASFSSKCTCEPPAARLWHLNKVKSGHNPWNP